jgi:hypothetical protein
MDNLLNHTPLYNLDRFDDVEVRARLDEAGLSDNLVEEDGVLISVFPFKDDKTVVQSVHSIEGGWAIRTLTLTFVSESEITEKVTFQPISEEEFASRAKLP